MREIKFRVWNGEEMVSPDYVKRDGEARWSENSIPQYSKEIMQFTGLYDKNGEEIYEGDIVDNKKTGTWEVVYHNGAFKFKMIKGKNIGYPNVLRYFDDYEVGKVIEVIGNIHEANPDLINGAMRK